jgi:hypothetical protein
MASVPRRTTLRSPARTPLTASPKVRAEIAIRNALLGRAPDAWFTPPEACLYLGIAPRTLRNARDAKRLVPDGRAGRTPVYRRSTLDAFLASKVGS